ncbi:DNA-binding protein [Paenibacillus sp. MY03]|uniref:helix-turn-helix domain-containing protein n=1 Tax=Paenibacillus sp. MY03 TaxID=302980 RepID=UPI000B3BFCE3|nr:helix-turn-helix domain-containing protein [Paenibacillus sp. MY03]OUS70273.1 DNA-binding protein [Paenibacillus sp. MY03]
MSQSIEAAIRAIVTNEVAAAEARLLEKLSAQPDRTMDIPEAAEHLGISEQLLYRMCRLKQIPHERYGVLGSKKPTVKIRMSDLEEWRAQQRAANCIVASEGRQ